VSQGSATVRFWGVRDHIAVPGPETAVYGGNTPCVEVRVNDALLIFDSGTGIRLLGRALARSGVTSGDLFFAHTQFDRISGLPFFGAAFMPGNAFRLWAGQPAGGPGIEDVLRQLMTDPIFPVPLEVMRAKLEFHDFRTGETLTPRPGIAVRTQGFNGEARPVTGYRIEHADTIVCYVTDVNPAHAPNESALATLIDSATLVVIGFESETATDIDAAWHWAAERCARARAGTMVLTNHGHGLDDARLDAIAVRLSERCAGALVAREGMVLQV
jgi:phosphoribosyl 1,2-cyclic phosphodiesterase